MVASFATLLGMLKLQDICQRQDDWLDTNMADGVYIFTGIMYKVQIWQRRDVADDRDVTRKFETVRN